MKLNKIYAILGVSALCFAPLGVQAKTVYATDLSGTQEYTSIDDAWDAVNDGDSIRLSCDWNLDSRLVLDGGVKAIIQMNGHKISRGLWDSERNGEVFKLCSKSNLTLDGTGSSTEFTVDVYSISGNHSSESQKITSGGLITGGNSTNGAGAVHMKQGSTLKLANVAIAGNFSDRNWGTDGNGGAIYMDGDDDTVNMVDSTIAYNYAEHDGGAIYMNDEHGVINMTNSHISYNTAYGFNTGDHDEGNGGAIFVGDENIDIIMDGGSIDHNLSHGYGGAIYSNRHYTDVMMTNSASINDNTAYSNGGGICFNYSFFNVISSDNTGSISNNTADYDNDSSGADYGGGIATVRCLLHDNGGTIKGITFDGNHSHIGGALLIRQEYITVEDCTFKNNSAELASAIDVTNDYFTLKNSTVTENKGAEAIYVDASNDITLEGTVNITNNIGEDDKEEDLQLYNSNLYSAKILSMPSSDSRVGLKLNSTGTFAKNQTSDAQNIYYFNDSDKYAFEFDDGEAKAVEASSSTQESSVKNYTVTLNVTDNVDLSESSVTSYEENMSASITAPNVEGKVFSEWQSVPDGATVDGDSVVLESITENVELTAVYTDEQTEEASTTGSMFGNGTIIGIVAIVGCIVAVAAFFLGKKVGAKK